MTSRTAANSAHDQAPFDWEITRDIPGPLRTSWQIWTHRRLLYFLSVRSLQRIYRRTVLGWLWLFILPLFPVLINTLVFGMLLRVASPGAPYVIFLMAGLLSWDLFATSLMWGTRGLKMHGELQDAQVPRILMPLGAMAPAVVDLLITTALLLLMLGYRSWQVGGTGGSTLSLATVTLAVAALAVAFLLAIGISLFTSVLGEETADMRYTLGQVLPIWFLLTPIIYPLSAVPESWRPWMTLNPMAAVVGSFKYASLGIGEPGVRELGIAALLAGAIFCLGAWYFARHDATVLDAR